MVNYIIIQCELAENLWHYVTETGVLTLMICNKDGLSLDESNRKNQSGLMVILKVLMIVNLVDFRWISFPT